MNWCGCDRTNFFCEDGQCTDQNLFGSKKGHEVLGYMDAGVTAILKLLLLYPIFVIMCHASMAIGDGSHIAKTKVVAACREKSSVKILILSSVVRLKNSKFRL